jgi:calcium homeostasis endoplasmic reticulum protein
MMNQRIETSNKGHQLLQKMGWSGQAGLGRHEQGIFNPIEGGEVRDKVDQFRGVGAQSDPFEAFRKNRSATYIQRLRDRDEQKESRLRKKNFVFFEFFFLIFVII